MERIIVTPPINIHTRIQLPSSKSLCNRALIINALAHGSEPPQNLSNCDDTRVMIRALQQMQPTIDIMAAGTAMRFLTAFLTVAPGTHLITGTERMKQRPIGILVDALRSLGADIDYAENEGFPPLRITGKKLDKENITLPGNVSSQYISALLMIAPTLQHGLTLTLEGKIVSRPYIDMTLQLMRDFGAQAEWIADNQLKVEATGYQPTPYYIESDWSAASYWYEICALTPDATVELPGLFEQSLQGDAAVAQIFSLLGVETSYSERMVTLRNTGKAVDKLEYDFVNQPDLAQTFVVTCCMKHIPFCFTGLESLKIKETDRIFALITEMKKLGYVVKEKDNSILYWDGERCPAQPHPAIDTYEDHRMAMAFAPASLILKSVCINHPQVVSKSYPNYWENLQEVGFNLAESNTQA